MTKAQDETKNLQLVKKEITYDCAESAQARVRKPIGTQDKNGEFSKMALGATLENSV
ncbi:MAG: hypothetical protein P4L53_14335 [Candidatus Obscuribacterales bacterium]|nr:hypothetical protein [Candidatus Obscuribacterales bacterium]